MKLLRASLILILSALSVATAAGQTSRVIDNFDLGSGIKIYTPSAPQPAPKTSKKVSKNSKRAQQVMDASEGFSSKTLTVQTSYTRMSMGSAASLRGFTTGDDQIDSYIEDSSRRYNIDPLLIYSQMHQESSFKLRATSYKGARGLMQLMPATAARFGVRDIYDPRQNIDAGVRYMRWLLNTFNQDLELALAGYNAGEGAVMKYGNQIPPYKETREYVRRITARYASVSDPRYVRSVKKVTADRAAKLEEKEARPLSVYEPRALAIKLPDGRMRLINQ